MCTIMHRSAAKFWWGVDLPKHIIYLHKTFSHEPWKEYTIYDRIKEKVKKQEFHIREKRAYNRKVTCYIWVFYNKSWIMGGWYVYIESRYRSFPLNFRTGEHERKILEKIMQKYHCGILFPEFTDQWADVFCKTFPKTPKGVKIKQGIKFTHCVLDNWNNLIDVL